LEVEEDPNADFAEFVPLSALKLKVADQFLYLFDVNNESWHGVRVTGIAELDEAEAAAKKLPAVVASVGALPTGLSDSDD
jgi:hypothetical protein